MFRSNPFSKTFTLNHDHGLFHSEFKRSYSHSIIQLASGAKKFHTTPDTSNFSLTYKMSRNYLCMSQKRLALYAYMKYPPTYTQQSIRYFYNFTLKSRLGPRLPKYVESSEEAPVFPSIEEVHYYGLKQIQNWKFWKHFEDLENKLNDASLIQEEPNEEEYIQRRKDIIKDFLAQIRDDFSCIKPDPARIFGLPQFLVTALRRFDTSPIQTDIFISREEQAKCFGSFNRQELVLPVHQRDSYLLPDFFGAFYRSLDTEERAVYRQKLSEQVVLYENLRKRLLTKNPNYQFNVDTTEESEIPQDSIFYDYQKKLARFKAVNPLSIQLGLDRLGTGKFYEIMKEGSENYTIICSKDAMYDGSFQKFTVDRTISSWISSLKRFQNDAHKNADIERSIAIFFLSRFIHLYYFNRKFRNAKPYDYLTSQYGLGSYSKRILYETCADGLEMVPYSTIIGMINEIIYGMREEGKEITLAINDCHEFSLIDRNRLITRDGERTDLLVKILEVVTDMDINKLLVYGSEANVNQIKDVTDNCLQRKISIAFERNQPLLDDGKKLIQDLTDISGCPILEGDLGYTDKSSSTLSLTDGQDSRSFQNLFLFKLKRCRPWIPSTVIHDLSQSGTLAPRPDKNIFLKQSVYHAYYELMSMIRSKIQITVHNSFYQEHLKELLLRIYISLFLFPSQETIQNTDPELDLVTMGLFPPKIESYASGRKEVNIIGEPVSFEALKMTIQDEGFIPDINNAMSRVIFRDFLKPGLISPETACLFNFLNNDSSKVQTIYDIFSVQCEKSIFKEWASKLYFSPELLIDGAEADISSETYWKAVLDLAKESALPLYQVGDRELPGLDGSITDARIYHSNLGSLSMNQFLFKPNECDETYCWFSTLNSKLYGIIISFGKKDLTNDVITTVSKEYSQKLKDHLEGFAVIQVELPSNIQYPRLNQVTLDVTFNS